jgi:hypothetical protein
MHIDELRGELTTLADEIEPFEGDVRSLHRRERRRRIVRSSLVAAFVVVVAASTVVVARHRDDGRVRVTGAGSKEVPRAQVSHFDVIVVPATPAVQDVFDASPLVARYARIPRAIRGSSLLVTPITRAALCAMESNDGFAVQASSPGSGFAEDLTRSLVGKAAVYDVSDMFGHDLEAFLDVGASSLRANAIRARIEADPTVSSFRYLSQRDAYAIFVKDFADQPDLVRDTKPTDLPVSFRINVKAGVSAESTAQRYGRLSGVASVIVTGASRLFAGTSLVDPAQRPTSACTKP